MTAPAPSRGRPGALRWGSRRRWPPPGLTSSTTCGAAPAACSTRSATPADHPVGGRGPPPGVRLQTYPAADPSGPPVLLVPAPIKRWRRIASSYPRRRGRDCARPTWT